jgi:hypothetical protein
MDLLATTQTLILRDIKVLHLEPTDVCQAACVLCARETDTNFDQSQQHHLSMYQILNTFGADNIEMLDKMFMCGNYGDPAAGKHTMNIYRQFRKINSDIVLGMNTNGALRTPQWWRELANILCQPRDYVVFSIDGLEDTNHLYRKNVKWSRLIDNVKAFIEAGGSAHWDMLVYRHNQDQVSACEQLARDLGFKWFRAKVSKRGFVHDLQQPIGWYVPKVTSSQIQCHALGEQSLYIDAQARVSPCCWLGATQHNFVTDFEQVQQSWHTDHVNPICASTCAVQHTGTSFTNQWQREVELC